MFNLLVNNIKYLITYDFVPNLRRGVNLFVICAVLVHCSLLANESHLGGETSLGKGRGQSSTQSAGFCLVSPNAVTDFAGGRRYDYQSMLNFLTVPTCRQSLLPQVIDQAKYEGLKFNSKGSIRLEMFGEDILIQGSSKKSVESMVVRNIPTLLQGNNISKSELLPLIGQLAIISPQAGRAAWMNLVQQELMTSPSGEGIDVEASSGEGPSIAAALVRLGVDRPDIALSLAKNVEEMATLAQGESLAKMFWTLGEAASENNDLTFAFTAAADGFRKGVKRGTDFYGVAERAGLTEAALIATKVALKGDENLQESLADFNSSLSHLTANHLLDPSLLKKMWRTALWILVRTSGQEALASLVAESLTPEMIFLGERDLGLLAQASRDYAPISSRVQDNYLLAWDRMVVNVEEGRLGARRFASIKKEIMEPLARDIITWNADRIRVPWLRVAIQNSLIGDEEIESRFPRLVLSTLLRLERISPLGGNGQMLPVMASMAENLSVVLALSHIHIPRLMKWVRTYQK